MTSQTKRFRFLRLPAPAADPGAWERYLKRDWPQIPAWAAKPALPADATRRLLHEYMPELLPDFDALLSVTADWGPAGAQALANYNLTPFFQGCSVTVSRANGHATLLRNYDLGLDDHNGIFQVETLPGGHWLLGSAETGWGYLDGVNSRGLAATITFGGRFTAADGFGIPILMRYILATCGTVGEATRFLQRMPHRLAQNFLLVDRQGDSAVVYTSGDLGVTVEEGALACTNHQQRVYVPRHAAFTRTVERLEHMQQAAGSLTLADMMRPPLYNREYREHFGTVYSAEYDPTAGTARYAWPGQELFLTPDSPDAEVSVTLHQP